MHKYKCILLQYLYSSHTAGNGLAGRCLCYYLYGMVVAMNVRRSSSDNLAAAGTTTTTLLPEWTTRGCCCCCCCCCSSGGKKNDNGLTDFPGRTRTTQSIVCLGFFPGVSRPVCPTNTHDKFVSLWSSDARPTSGDAAEESGTRRVRSSSTRVSVREIKSTHVSFTRGLIRLQSAYRRRVVGLSGGRHKTDIFAIVLWNGVDVVATDDSVLLRFENARV